MPSQQEFMQMTSVRNGGDHVNGHGNVQGWQLRMRNQQCYFNLSYNHLIPCSTTVNQRARTRGASYSGCQRLFMRGCRSLSSLCNVPLAARVLGLWRKTRRPATEPETSPPHLIASREKGTTEKKREAVSEKKGKEKFSQRCITIFQNQNCFEKASVVDKHRRSLA